jgi:hypothetical protein
MLAALQAEIQELENSTWKPAWPTGSKVPCGQHHLTVHKEGTVLK